jgi:hypothetical protein
MMDEAGAEGKLDCVSEGCDSGTIEPGKKVRVVSVEVLGEVHKVLAVAMTRSNDRIVIVS